MAKNNTSIAKSLKKAGFYDAEKNKEKRLIIINDVTTKPQRLEMVDKLFLAKKLKSGGVSLAVGRGESIRKTTKGKGRNYLSVEEGAGMTEAGRKAYNAKTGSNLKAPQPQGGPRKDSFCARMEPVARKSDRGSRARASMKRWNCPGW